MEGRGREKYRRKSIGSFTLLRAAFVRFAVAAALCAQAQIVNSGAQGHSAARADAVAYLFPEQVTVPANKPSRVDLHFRIAQGLHINSHTPSEDYLIPTSFSVPDHAGVRLDAATYPDGTQISLPVDPKTRLSVNTGEFVIQVRVVAAPGNHLVEARLHYQACDNNECMPPKTISVPIDFIGK